MTVVTTRRLIVAVVVAVVALVVGVVFGYLAGVAVVLGAISLVLFGLGSVAGLETTHNIGRNWGRERFGSQDNDRSER